MTSYAFFFGTDWTSLRKGKILPDVQSQRREQSLFVGQLISTLDFSGRQKKALLRQGLHLPDQHLTTF